MVRSVGTAWLHKRTADGGEEIVYLPDITNLECTHTANLTEMSTIIYGYQGMFVIDMGNSLKYSVTCKRVNPPDYDDNSSDPTRWSNGKWYRDCLEPFFNYWQNLGLDVAEGSTTMVGGFRFHFVPADTDVHEEIDRNVFLSGTLNLQYSTTYLVVQMNLQVARMQTGESGTGSTYTVTLHMTDTDGVEQTYVVQVPAEFVSAIPYCPQDWSSEWQDAGAVFAGWCLTSSADTVDYKEGDPYTYTSDLELWAIWTSALDIAIYLEAGEYVYEPPEDAGYIRIYCVGGGGGAGNCARGVFALLSEMSSGNAGGAGAGGEVTVIQRSIIRSGSSDSPRYQVVVGAGGARGDDKSGIQFSGPDGHTGGESYVDGLNYNASNVSRDATLARGGAGGKGGQFADQGGIRTADGGSSDTAPGGGTRTRTDGEDGGTSAPNIDSNAGSGHRAYFADVSSGEIGYAEAPGAGGGAAAFRYRFFVNGMWYPRDAPEYNTTFPNEYFESRGGDGGGLIRTGLAPSDYGYVESTAGICGGGGGSASPLGTYSNCEKGSAGGDGAVIIVALPSV